MDQTSSSQIPIQTRGSGENRLKLTPTRQQVRALQALHTSLVDLAALVTGTSGPPDFLEQVATYAAHAIPGADGAGVTLLRLDRANNRVEALAASDPFVAEIDRLQYVTVNEGPSITAASERRTVRSGSLYGEKLWPHFGPWVGQLGIQSALSLPLLIPGQVLGAIGVYARGKDVFDDHTQELGELLAAPVAVAVHNALTLSQAITLTTRLQTSLAARPVTDEAAGLIRTRTGLSSAKAREQLHTMSQQEHLKLIEVAQHLVDDAAQRARARDAASDTPPPMLPEG